MHFNVPLHITHWLSRYFYLLNELTYTHCFISIYHVLQCKYPKGFAQDQPCRQRSRFARIEPTEHLNIFHAPYYYCFHFFRNFSLCINIQSTGSKSRFVRVNTFSDRDWQLNTPVRLNDVPPDIRARVTSPKEQKRQVRRSIQLP